jgi:thiamine-phosphate pyrophosphorylase
LRVGVSTHNETQLVEALTLRPDYVAFGPIFATASKAGADPALGLEALGRAAALASAAGIPLVAIGGLTLRAAAALGRQQVLAAIAARAVAWQAALSAA